MQGPRKIAQDTGFSNFTEREAVLAHLEEAIVASDDVAARSWSKRYNDLNPISHLPPELLSLVFEFSQRNYFGSQHWYRDAESLDWIPKVSHVCSYWRRVALACSTLWTNIHFQSPCWAMEMLTRSQTSPLKIVAAFDKIKSGGNETSFTRSRAAMTLVVAQVHRIRELSLIQHTAPNDEFLALVTSLQSPAPIMETYSVIFASVRLRQRFPELDLEHILWNYPNLKHFKLENCTVQWKPMSSWSNLRSLSIVGAIPKSVGPPAHYLFIALSHMTSLESLALWIIFTSTVEPPSPNVNLPLLQSLNFTSNLPNCIFFLDHVTFPNTTYVDITVLVGIYEASISAVGYWALIKHLYQPLKNPIDSIEVRGPFFLFSDRGEKPCPRFRVSFSVPVRCSLMDEMEMAKNLPVIFSLNHLKSLRIDCQYLQNADWLNLFEELAELDTIEIGDGASVQFLIAFSTSIGNLLPIPEAPADRTSNIDRPSITLPALRCMSICHWCGDNSSAEDLWECTLYQQLAFCLLARRMRGYPIQTLQMYDCLEVSEDDMAILKSSVGCIDGNSIEEEPDSEESCSPPAT